MKFALVLVACVADQPDVCREESVQLPEIRNATACYLGAQFTLRDWIRDHPEMELADARCAPADDAVAAAPAPGESARN